MSLPFLHQGLMGLAKKHNKTERETNGCSVCQEKRFRELLLLITETQTEQLVHV